MVIKLHLSPAMKPWEIPQASPAGLAGPNPASKAKKHAYELLAQRLEAQSVQSDKVPQGRVSGITGLGEGSVTRALVRFYITCILDSYIMLYIYIDMFDVLYDVLHDVLYDVIYILYEIRYVLMYKNVRQSVALENEN